MNATPGEPHPNDFLRQGVQLRPPRHLRVVPDAELAVQELVRRAELELGIGVAMRKAQEAGEIRRRNEGGGLRGDYVRDGQIVRVTDPAADNSRKSPGEVVRRDELARAIYLVADGVTDEQFNAAVNEAKAEGNLSRANVVRKVAGRSPARLAPEQAAVAFTARRGRHMTQAPPGWLLDLLAEVD